VSHTRHIGPSAAAHNGVRSVGVKVSVKSDAAGGAADAESISSVGERSIKIGLSVVILLILHWLSVGLKARFSNTVAGVVTLADDAGVLAS